MPQIQWHLNWPTPDSLRSISGEMFWWSLPARTRFGWYFRRALRLVNGAAPNLPTPGFTVAAENPVYVQGDYNAAGSFAGAHSYAAIIADTVTMLSNNWRDINGFDNPYAAASRPGTTTWYRMAIAAGKVIGFPQPAGAASDVGLDAGVINFLRYIEDWTGATLNYTGSLVSMYYSRQATSNYKCCGVVYQPPTRAYSFDTEFLVPSSCHPARRGSATSTTCRSARIFSRLSSGRLTRHDG